MNARPLAVATLLLLAALPVLAKSAMPKNELAGIRLGMSEEQVKEKLSRTGTVAPEKGGDRDEGDQQTWSFKSGPYGFVSIGYNDDRANWVTAFVREHGKPVRFSDIGPLAAAQPSGSRQWIWNVAARGEAPAYRVIARGRDSVNVVSISLLHTGPLSESHSHEREDHENGEHEHGDEDHH
jgi:hypothetical protein